MCVMGGQQFSDELAPACLPARHQRSCPAMTGPSIAAILS
jgi:hypothetical protein